MLKKLSMFMMAAVLIAVFSACSVTGKEKLTAEEIYKKAAEKQQEVTTADMDVIYTVNMSSAGESTQMDMNMKIRSDLSDKDNIKLGVSSEISAPGTESINMNYAYIDNMIYVDTAGLKYKSAVSAADAEKITGSTSANNIFAIENIIDAELTKDGDDSIVTFQFDEKAFNDIMKDNMGALAGAEGVSYNFTEFSGRAVIDKDYNMKSVKLMMGFTLSENETEVTISADVDVNINSVGKPVSISAPSDAENYTEVSPDTLMPDTAA